jgi:nucleoside-diphosphate-sugar epimerase
MRILILGGSGYLSSYLSNYLLKKNQVTVGSRDKKKIDYNYPKLRKIQINYYSNSDLKKKIINFDIVFHLVGMSSRECNKKGEGSIRIKKKITNNILEACEKNNVKKLVYFSSIKVYENYSKKKNITEKSKKNINDFYSKAHLEAEKIILKGKNSIILRLSNVFGIISLTKSKELQNTIVNKFCKECLQGKITIQDPNTVRNFLPGIMLCKFVDMVISKKFNKSIIFNVGYKSMSIYEIVKRVISIYQSLFSFKPLLYFLKIYKNPKKFNYKSKLKNMRFNNKIFNDEIKNTLNVLKKNINLKCKVKN